MYDGAGVNGRKNPGLENSRNIYFLSFTPVTTRISKGHEYEWLRTGNELPSSIFEFLDFLIKPHPACI